MFSIQKKQVTDPLILDLSRQISLIPSQTLVYANSHSGTINILMRHHNAYRIRSFSKSGNTCLQFRDEQNKLINTEIGNIYVEESQAFIFCLNPIQIFYLTLQHGGLIQISPQQPINLVNSLCFLLYPFVYFYGSNNSTTANLIMKLDLNTLAVKTVCEGKGYCPGYRTDYVGLFEDQRIYVFGGTTTKNKKCENLVWIFDIDKGYWFALEMQYPDDIGKQKIQHHAINRNKSLLTCEDSKKMWVFQLHQSNLFQLKESYEFQGFNLVYGGWVLNINKKGQCWVWDFEIVGEK